MTETKLPIGSVKAGHELKVLSESPVVGGVIEQTFSLDAECAIMSLFVSAISSTIDVEVYTVGDDGQQILVATFETVSSPTPDLVLLGLGNVLQRVKVVVKHSGAATFEIRVRGANSNPNLLTTQNAMDVEERTKQTLAEIVEERKCNEEKIIEELKKINTYFALITNHKV